MNQRCIYAVDGAYQICCGRAALTLSFQIDTNELWLITRALVDTELAGAALRLPQ
jgi:hypothetical protein